MQTEFQLAASTTIGVENMIFRVLTSPQFLHHLQIDVQQVNANTYKLSSYLVARKLAFMFTQTLPDENLLNIAANNDLSLDPGFNLALSSVSANMKSSISQFTSEWLHLDKLPVFSDVNNNKFKYITTNLGITANDSLRKAMSDEVIELINYVTGSNKNYKEIFNSNISFTRDPNLMAVYGLTAAAPSNVSDTNAVRFPAGERSGLLTRAALLLSGTASENPVMRGIHTRKDILCLTLGDPPADPSALTPPPLDPNLTTRERYQQKTSSASCIGCHSQINPVGFSFSKYNAIGGFQNVEPVFDINQQLINQLPTDSKANLQIPLGINKEVQNALEFSDEIANSKTFKKCFSQNFYSYIYGLNERTKITNSCALNKMYNSLNNGESLQSFFKSSVSDFRFRYRKIVK